MRRHLYLLAGMLLSPCLMHAQVAVDTPALSPGARVRVTVDSGPPAHLLGVFAAYRADSLWVQPVGGSAALPVPRSRVLRLEVSRGHSSYRRLGGTLGLLAGMGVGALIGRGKTYNVGDNTPWIQLFASAVLGGLFGAGIGGSIHRDRWETLAWP